MTHDNVAQRTVGQPWSLPRGWYALGLADDFRPGQVNTTRLGADDVVAWRNSAGAISACEPYCPHLGAHLGHGGAVVDDTLRCPMHFFRFNGEGACIATGYGTKPPPKARLRTFPLAERGGLLLAFSDSSGARSWPLPELEQPAWGSATRLQFTVSASLDEVARYAADLTRLAPVRGFDRIESLAPPEASAEVLRSRWRLTRGERASVELDVSLYGLGLCVIDALTHPGDVRARLVFAMTPLAARETELHVALWIKHEPTGAQWRRWLTGELARLGIRTGVNHNLRRLHPSTETPGDDVFAAWVRQF